MLNVMIGQLKKERQPHHEILIDDLMLYRVLNGDLKFEEKNYNQDEIESLMNKIIELSQNKDILLHTFNPLFLNYIDDDIAKEGFVYFDDNENKFKKFFDLDVAKRKLKSLAAGDVIADINISKLI